MEDEYFEEVCHLCGRVKMVHDDMMTGLDNPGFICKECEETRDRILGELTTKQQKEWDDEH